MAITCNIEMSDIYRAVRSVNADAEKVIKATIYDFKDRAPSWVAQEVTKKYNIAKKEINLKRGLGGTGGIATGSIRAKGRTIGSASLVYEGRVLTPTHFKMSPKKPKKSGEYTLGVEIKKGNYKPFKKGENKKLTKEQRKNIGRNFTRQGTKNSPESPVRLMPTGSTYIPFQRKSQRRNDIEVIRTLSVPQMVSNDEVKENIQKAINEKLGERLETNMRKFMR